MKQAGGLVAAFNQLVEDRRVLCDEMVRTGCRPVVPPLAAAEAGIIFAYYSPAFVRSLSPHTAADALRLPPRSTAARVLAAPPAVAAALRPENRSTRPPPPPRRRLSSGRPRRARRRRRWRLPTAAAADSGSIRSRSCPSATFRPCMPTATRGCWRRKRAGGGVERHPLDFMAEPSRAALRAGAQVLAARGMASGTRRRGPTRASAADRARARTARRARARARRVGGRRPTRRTPTRPSRSRRSPSAAAAAAQARRTCSRMCPPPSSTPRRSRRYTFARCLARVRERCLALYNKSTCMHDRGRPRRALGRSGYTKLPGSASACGVSAWKPARPVS